MQKQKIFHPLYLLLLISLSCFAQANFFQSNEVQSSEFNADDNLHPTTTEFLPVEQAYQLTVEFDGDEAILIWQITNDYFLYRHGFKHEWKINGTNTPAEFTLSDGIKKQDDYFGEVEIYYSQVVLHLPLPSKETMILKTSSQGCADAGLCYPPHTLYFAINPQEKTASTITAADFQSLSVKTTAPANPSFLWILFAALLGGLILNLMPCVFPVLSIKVMQLARQHDTKTAQYQGLAYLTGVVLSFVSIAAVMLSLRASGNAIGWGFQLQSPWFIASLVYLFFVLGLSMSGVLHIGQRWMGFGQSLTEKNGLQGAFFTGVLAVVVASPCTAPFMGTALGYAIGQSTFTAITVFAVLGFGMALPITLVSFIPAASRMLPKPGHWMERLKEFFAYPLYATSIWLLWVLGNQTSTNGMAVILLGCVSLSFAFWCFKSHQVFTRIIGLLFALTALSLPFSHELAVTEKPYTGQHTEFSAQRLAELRQQGQAVFIDLTADWCITCIANEKTTLELTEVQQAFKDAGIVYMVGDWTHFNPEITALLNEYQRSGIPLYLLYPPVANAPAIILPQLLSKGIVLNAINNIK